MRLPPLTLKARNENGTLTVTFYDVTRVSIAESPDIRGKTIVVYDGVSSGVLGNAGARFPYEEHGNGQALLDWQRVVNYKAHNV